MNSVNPIKPRDVDFSKISFSTPRALGSSGAKMLYLNYDNGPLEIQLPDMRVGWDVKFWPAGDDPSSGKYQVSLKFDKTDDTKQNEMHEFLDKLDKCLLEACYENRIPWLKKPSITKEGVKLLYTPLVKRSINKETGEVDGKWPDEFRIKLAKRDGVSQFKLFDENKVEINQTEEGFELSELIMKGTNLKGLVRCNGVWCGAAGFGCTWKGTQLKLKTPPKVKAYSFEDTDDSEEDGEKSDSSDSDNDSDSE